MRRAVFWSMIGAVFCAGVLFDTGALARLGWETSRGHLGFVPQIVLLLLGGMIVLAFTRRGARSGAVTPKQVRAKATGKKKSIKAAAASQTKLRRQAGHTAGPAPRRKTSAKRRRPRR